jgi:serine/threonine-protein kinase
VVHRDVKPSNVMICDRTDGLLVKVVDFGMAKRFLDAGATAITRTGEPRGTLLFASPECLRDAKRARPAADLYSVGATLYFALTGRPYFDEETHGRNVYAAVLGAQVVPLAQRRRDVPPALATLVESAIRERPEDRPASAAAMLGALVAAAAGLPRR